MPGFVGPRRDKNITIETATEEEASFFDNFTNKFKNRVSEEMDKYSQERVDLSRLHHYSYPIDLNGSAQETGLPFIRFGIKPVTATERVAIYLYQPPGFSVSDGANYANFDVGSIRGGLNLLKSAASGQGPNITNADVGAFAMMGKDKLLGGSSTIDKITSAGAINLGIATNPYTRTAYESTNVRTFSFSFKLIAENERESDMAKRIERTFRKFLYPKRAGSVALVYPPLIDIQFYSNGGINPYMPKIKPCYITSLESTFNEGSTAMHKDSGAPLEVNLTIGFQEERVLVRQDLYETDDSIDERESGYYIAETTPFIATDKNVNTGDV
jgi:hypothetical protein